ncbi:hypothetical protein [Thomasclavelia cocleata]|uniref:hypothetical protein n=1 Tax=Thomasclavelia cocleata TaxID=69824 RepID=UPI00258B61A7|nr:hypothetical protein [Thomasclavelia cocleata]
MKKQDVIKILEEEYFYQRENYDNYYKQNDKICNFYYGGMIAVISIYSALNNSITHDQAKVILTKAYYEHIQNKEVKK